MAIKAIINNTEKEIEQIKNSNEQDVDYVYSRIGDTEVEGESPISIKSIGGELANYRIYGKNSRNILPLSKTPKTETIGDILCEYDGNGTFTFTSNVNNPTYPYYFIVPLAENFYFPNPLSDYRGSGCIQIYNDYHYYTHTPTQCLNVTFACIENGEIISGFELPLLENNAIFKSYNLIDLDYWPANAIVFKNLNNIFNRTITMKPAVYLNVSNRIPYEPYGELVGDRTANLFDMKKFAELCYPNSASVIFTDNTLSFTSTGTDAYVNMVFGEGDIVYKHYRPSCIDVLPSTTYTISMSSTPKCFISWIDSSYTAVSAYTRIPVDQSSYTFTTPSNCTKLLIRLGKTVNNIGDTFTISNIMLNEGSTALSYEPYGYKVPVKAWGKNLLQNTQGSISLNGVQYQGSINLNGVLFTLNADGSVSFERKSAYNYKADLYIVGTNIADDNMDLNIGSNYIISGGVNSNAYIGIQGFCPLTHVVNTSDITVSSTMGKIFLRVTPQENGNGTFYPMIRKADIEDDTYEPYRTPVTTPIYLPEQIKKVGDEVEYIDYSEQKLHKIRKNLLQNTATSQTINGVIVTVNEDKSISLSFEAVTYTRFIEVNGSVDVEMGDILSGCPYIGVNGLELRVTNNETGYYESDIGRGVTIVNPAVAGNAKVIIRIPSYYANSNLTFYPMIRKADMQDDTYEPYIENADLDVTLPALSTIKGTNTLSVNTSIQPSNMYIKDNFDYKKVFTATRAIEDKSPLNYRSIEDSDSTLKNYRIYGQTVDGESVGDRTGNLFDVSTIVENKYINSSGIETAATAQYQENMLNHTDFINVSNGIAYSLRCVMPYTIRLDNTIDFCWFDDNKSFISRNTTLISAKVSDYSFSARSPLNASYLIINFIGYVDETTYMLNEGSTPLPYEPYGYKVPMTVSNGTDTLTTPIYLPEQIRMVGDEAEYIDYGEQKQHRVRENYLQSSDFEGGAIYTGETFVGRTYELSKTPGGLLDYDTTRKRSTDLITIIGTYTISIADGWEFGVVMFPNDINSGESFIYNTEPLTISNCTFAIQIRKTDISDISSADISDYQIMLNKGTTAIPYEPYIENTDLDVTLPALPMLRGTNTLSVETEIQPSEVYIKGKIKPVYNPYIFGSLPFTFEAKGLLIRKYEFENNSNNTIGTKTANLVPDLDGWIMGKALTSWGEVQNDMPTLMISDFIEIEPSTSYKFGAVGKVTNEAGTWHRVVYFDENKANISFVDNNYMNTSFTTPATAKYLRLCTTFWYQPFLVKSSDSYTYVPYGYNIPIVLNNITYQAYLPEPLEKELICENGNNVSSITFTNGETYNPAGGTFPEAFVILGPTNNQYTSYGYVTYGKIADKYVFGTTGTNTRLINPGTYTMCLTVHNPPLSNTWQISFFVGTYTNRQFYWKSCRCNSENTVNDVATASYTFTIDDTNETQISFAMIRFDTFNTDATIKEWYSNTKVDISIIEGTEPVFATRTLINNNDEVIPIAEMPQLTTINGSNTIDVNITPKPTEVKLFLN